MAAGSASIHGATGHQGHNVHDDHNVLAFARQLANYINSGALNGSIQSPRPPTVAGSSSVNPRDTIYPLGSGAHTISATGSSHSSAAGSVPASPTVTGASGNQTLFGGTGFNLTFLGGTRNASVAGATGGANALTASSVNQTLTGGSSAAGDAPFTFMQHDSGASSLIGNFSTIVPATSHSSPDIASSLQHQTVGPGGVSIAMPDDTTFTFVDLTKLKH